MLEPLIREWGYLAVAAGAFAEGETILLAAGYAARAGLLHIGWVLVVAVLAATAGDQFFYWIGRTWGTELLRRYPRLAAQTRRVTDLLRRYPAGAIIAVRFLYGLRIAGPILIGASGVPPGRFLLFNFAGAVLWACAIGGLGWGFGQAWALVSERLQGAEYGLVALLALVVVIWAGARAFGARRRVPKLKRPTDP